jgi:hypothetical protein
MIGHHRTSFECVNVSQYKVSDILNICPAKVTPEERARFDVPLKLHPVPVEMEQVI